MVTSDFTLTKENNRLQTELDQCKLELRQANAQIGRWRNKCEILEIEVGVLRESRANTESKVEDRLRRQLVKQRKQISDLKAAIRFEEFDEDSGEYRKREH